MTQVAHAPCCPVTTPSHVLPERIIPDCGSTGANAVQTSSAVECDGLGCGSGWWALQLELATQKVIDFIERLSRRGFVYFPGYRPATNPRSGRISIVVNNNAGMPRRINMKADHTG